MIRLGKMMNNPDMKYAVESDSPQRRLGTMVGRMKEQLKKNAK